MAANPERSSPEPPEIIDLDSDEFLVEDQPEVFVAAQESMNRTATLDRHQEFLREALNIFPDISHDHVQKIWDKRAPFEAQSQGELNTVHQGLIEKILDGGAYPKERDRLKELKKRKRDSPEVEAG